MYDPMKGNPNYYACAEDAPDPTLGDVADDLNALDDTVAALKKRVEELEKRAEYDARTIDWLTGVVAYMQPVGEGCNELLEFRRATRERE